MKRLQRMKLAAWNRKFLEDKRRREEMDSEQARKEREWFDSLSPKDKLEVLHQRRMEEVGWARVQAERSKAPIPDISWP